MNQMIVYLNEVIVPMEDLVKQVREAYLKNPSPGMESMLKKSNDDLRFFYHRFDQLLELHRNK